LLSKWKDYFVVLYGRVIDPERYLDDVRDVGIRDGRIVTVMRDKLSGEQSVAAQGLIVAPGFIDCHSHGQNNLADRVHAFYGVTTVLELEAGILPVGRWYDIQASKRRVLNYGTASSWVFSRFVTLEGIPLSKEPRIQLLFFTAFGHSKWSNDVATPEQLDQIVNKVEQGLKEGGLGIGAVPGYAPGTGYKELLAVQTLAANYKVPTYWHVRSVGDADPLSAAQAYGEVISFAAATDSHVHICQTRYTQVPIQERELAD
jgi:N-acyl-D-glutamate deacylase